MSRSSISHSSRRGSTTGGGSSSDTVGYLLAGIAMALNDGLRIMHFADKRGWGPDEFEQVRALDEALDEAKADFQAMGPLVNGQFFYESDRTRECFFIYHYSSLSPSDNAEKQLRARHGPKLALCYHCS